MLEKKSIYKKKWKVVKCDGMEKCLCRVIIAIDSKPVNKDRENYYFSEDIFMHGGCINKEQAEYFVELHNKHLGGE